MLDPVLYPLATDRFISAVEYLTDITPVGNQKEYRIARGDEGLLTFDAMPGIRSLTDLRAFISFFRRRKGRARAFLVRDLFDYQQAWDGSLAPIGVADGNADTEYQLSKTYEKSDDAEVEVRTITKARWGTIKVYVDSVEETHVTFTNGYQGTGIGTDTYLCTKDGKFKFDTGYVPAADAVIEAKFEFFTPVRFMDDKAPVDEIFSLMKVDPNHTDEWILSSDTAGELPKVMMIEVKET